MYRTYRVVEFDRDALLGQHVLIAFVDRKGKLLELPGLEIPNPIPAFITSVASEQLYFKYRAQAVRSEYENDRDESDEDLPEDAYYTIIKDGGLSIGEAYNDVNLENNPSQQQFRKITILDI
jgi:hypothetical protein